MFSSLATFLFGAQATSESTNCEANPVPANLNDSGNDQATAGDVIEVTSSTPSVAGNSRGTVRGSGKRGGAKNRRARQRQQQQLQQQQLGGQRKQPPTITKLLTPNGESIIDEDIDEDEWYIVEKEGKFSRLSNLILILSQIVSIPKTSSIIDLSFFLFLFD